MKHAGFSLVEIIITLVIIAIVSAIALPIYSQHTMRAKRLAAEIALTKLAVALDQHYTITNSYQNITINDLHITSPQQYQLEITSATDTTFSLAANPQSEQATLDTKCATLTLNSNGEKGTTGFGQLEECW